MKTGVILYVIGRDSKACNYSKVKEDTLHLSADCVEIVSETDGHSDISYAWWHLLTRGMQRIICKIAYRSSSGELVMSGRELRLCG